MPLQYPKETVGVVEEHQLHIRYLSGHSTTTAMLSAYVASPMESVTLETCLHRFVCLQKSFTSLTQHVSLLMVGLLCTLWALASPALSTPFVQPGSAKRVQQAHSGQSDVSNINAPPKLEQVPSIPSLNTHATHAPAFIHLFPV